MPEACIKCRRLNPSEAAFCHYDGTPLANGQRTVPTQAAGRTFIREFVFPSGRVCRTFDELALACVQDRPAAIELLRGGYLESFLGGIGRTDLAGVAKNAAKESDPHLGLEKLLERLPTKALDVPKLQVEPLFINLGQLEVGRNQQFTVHVTNHGLRLLKGTISVAETPWLSFSPDAAVTEKTFYCEHELELPVYVLGKRLQAAKKAQAGKLYVDSNGGAAEVVITADVAIRPFATGLLAGAQTQRQLAEMAFKHAKDAAPYFERGEVARWYSDNGWTYPVQAPTASGLAALQQYLEACGLAQPPKVQLETPRLQLRGRVGQKVEEVVRLKAIDKKPAFAYAWSDKQWLVPRTAELKGTRAAIPIEIPKVPPASNGSPLAATLTVVSNGKQRFVIPVELEVLAAEQRPAPPPVAVVAAKRRRVEVVEEVQPAPARRDPWLHALPAIFLLLILGILILVDALRPRGQNALNAFDARTGEPLDDRSYVDVAFNDQSYQNFGILIPGSAFTKRKKLTFDEFGRTNNTIVRLNGSDFVFGREGRPGREHRDPRMPIENKQQRSWQSFMEYGDFGVRVLQDVSIRRSDVTGKLETCLIRYQLMNVGSQPTRVGIRFMLDTFIGDNDGVPFTIPGRDGLCDTMEEFNSTESVPDFVQALERANLEDPGTVANLTLKVRDPEGKLELPSRVQLSSWPNSILGMDGALGGLTRWHVPMASIKRTPPRGDSCVVIYWQEKELAPGQVREMAVAYGIGQVKSTADQGSGQLGLTVNGAFRPGSDIIVTAYVNRPEQGQRVKLQLPDGLTLVDGESLDREVKMGLVGTYAPVTWRVRADRQGEFEIVVRSGKYEQAQSIRIRAKSFLD